MAVIASLPEKDRPSFFGLPTNIDRSSQRTVSGHVIAQLKVVMRGEGSGDRFDRTLWSTELGPLLSMWKKLNQVLCIYMKFFLFSFFSFSCSFFFYILKKIVLYFSYFIF